MFAPKYDPEQYRRWLTSFFRELAPDFFGWLEDINLEEYCLGDDTRKFCLDKGIVPFETWANDSMKFGG